MPHGRYPRCFTLTGTYVYVTLEAKKEGGEPDGNARMVARAMGAGAGASAIAVRGERGGRIAGGVGSGAGVLARGKAPQAQFITQADNVGAQSDTRHAATDG